MAWDLDLFYLLHNLTGKSRFLDWPVIFLADYLQYFLGALFLFFIFRKILPSDRWRVFWSGIAAVAVSRGIITELIRHFYRHPRPFDALGFVPLVPESGNSFPSGHMTLFFALSAAIYYYDRKYGWWFFTASILMGIARIIAGVHWPTDILGGVIIGLAVGFTAAKIISVPKKEII